MKKILLSLLMLVACMATEAKVIKITLADGTVKVFTSSELAAIDFNEDGTLTITTYDNQVLPALEADFESIDIGYDNVVTETYPDQLSFNIDADGIPVDLHSDRDITKMNYVYTSTDPWGEPISLSGTILIPQNIWDGTDKCEGILMVNHYTKFHRDEAPTISNGELESMLLANQLKPNYIIVESDFYGFGATVRFTQAFLQGLVNARSSLDGLLAAKEILDEMGFDYGPLCFNIGYSSGGFDALAAQKLRDMEYADRISFDKTFSGGGPSDVCEAYRQYVILDRTAYNAVPLLLMVTTNETQRLNIDYADIFQPYICNRIDELILSKNYSSWPVCDEIGREKLIHEILMPAYCDLESPESMVMQNLFTSFSLNNEDSWTPDPSQRIYLFHSRGDDYVPIKSARPMISFLKSKGLKPSIIPGRTNFQTNFVVRNMGHLSATLIYFVQTLAAIKAWPEMYTDNQLNPAYASLVSAELNPVDIMRQLDAMGFDCRGFIQKVQEFIASHSEGSEIPLPDLATIISSVLEQQGITIEELAEMSEDSGLDIQAFLMELITYLNEPVDTGEGEGAGEGEGEGEGEGVEEGGGVEPAPQWKALYNKNATPCDVYEQQLRDWLNQSPNINF